MKRGWVKIFEATIAILIVMSVLLITTVKQIDNGTKNYEDEIYQIQNNALNKISINQCLRGKIIDANRTKSTESQQAIENMIFSEIPDNFNFEIKICEINKVCPIDNYASHNGQNIYAQDKAISGNESEYAPLKIKLFMWEGEKNASKYAPFCGDCICNGEEKSGADNIDDGECNMDCGE